MNRREFLLAGPALWVWQQPEAPPPIAEPHFPTRLYQFVWRNWELANVPRMAEVIRASERDVLALGGSMGLPKKRRLTDGQLRRIYITVIRQNWHLLPERQIIELLGWDAGKFAFTLKEDDFLDHKLGPKPACPELIYEPPTPEQRRQAARIRALLRETLGRALREPGQEPFQFVRELADPRYPSLRERSRTVSASEADLSKGWSIRAPQQELLASAAKRLQEYLHSAMEADVALGGAGRAIRFALDPRRFPQSEDFEVEVMDNEVRITGGGEEGVLQGIYWLEEEMESRGAPFLEKGVIRRQAVWTPRFLYSYVALYGDPLMEPDIDPFPDAYLEKLARRGVNGVWMQAVLNTLAPSEHFPEFGAGWEMRLERLGALVRRARKLGVRIYLYLNEPRAMPAAFFDKYPEIRGAPYGDLYSMCTSVPKVRAWIADTIAHVMKHVPDLGGWFSITMSENHTNCFSHGGAWGKGAPVAQDCPRCSQRTGWEVIAELIQTFRDGVRRQSAGADLIAWDWGWGDQLAQNLIPLLPKDVHFQSISEWEQPVHRGGVQARVGEYSISVVGPGPRAARNWELARKHGLKTTAKVQFNVTWEISAVPYVPVPHLILEHCENLRRAGISGVMLSWTCGGYPSPNLAAAKACFFDPARPAADVLAAVARQRFGDRAAAGAVEAWRRFSEAYREFPYGVAIYIIPTQHGPANLLRFHPTGRRSGMILFPHDNVKAWSGAYPPEVVASQFTKMASLWLEGLTVLRQAVPKVSPQRRATAEADLAIAETCYHHFQSTAHQVEFYILRDKLGAADSGERARILERMRAIAEAEIEIARRQFPVARRHSAIAFEASNHYYYTPLDLAEKILNCRHLLDSVLQA
jgi:hypothetical protein